MRVLEVGIKMGEDYQCKRCGACCVYPRITEFYLAGENWAAPVFKEPGEVCVNLAYDINNGTATCKVHEEERPEACKRFRCDESRLGTGMILGLRITSRRMPEIMQSRMPQNVTEANSQKV